MSATLVAKDLAGGHAHRTLFESLDLTVAPGDVVGVVGANGAGKSTLLRLLAGDVDAAGRHRVAPRPPTPSSAGCRRSTSASPGETVAGYVARRTGAAGGDGGDGGDRRRRSAPTARRAPTTPTPPRSTTGWPAAPPTSTTALPAVLADLGLDVGTGRADDLAVRRPGRPRRRWPRCC